MTSPVKLPPLPLEIESVYVNVDGLSTYREARDCYYTMDQMHAYAEQAVREALAAQYPVGMLSRGGRLYANQHGISAAEIRKDDYLPLAIIPEFDKEPPCPPTSDSGHPT